LEDMASFPENLKVFRPSSFHPFGGEC
jgi:hypothetical protein